ncbi:MAG: hypothetical protein ACR2NF_02690 [Pirellulales bacterium]
MDEGYYYSPFQYELRSSLFDEEGMPGELGKALSLALRVGVPAPVVAGVASTALFLAYTPLLQPGPPARRGDPFILAPINLGGGLII